MKPWEIWDFPFPWGQHPAVIISNAVRVEMKDQIVVLPCTTMRQTPRDPIGCEALLDESDGLEWKTLCKCDTPFTISKSMLIRKRGMVGQERRRDIARKIQQGFAFEGL